MDKVQFQDGKLQDNKMSKSTNQMNQELADKVNSDLQEAGEQIKKQASQIRNRAQNSYEASAQFIRKHPVLSILGATAVGMVAGRVLRRRSAKSV